MAGDIAVLENIEVIIPTTENARQTAPTDRVQFIEGELDDHISKGIEQDGTSKRDPIKSRRVKDYLLSKSEEGRASPIERVLEIFDYLEPPSDLQRRATFEE